MIPKIIHYCWFGGSPMPDLAVRCIESWKRFLPDYEIKEWNEGNFDVNAIPYTRDAYAMKKYAFVSDYARFWIIYHYGGIYFDVDVEIVKSIDDILSRGSYMGMEIDSIKGKTYPTVAPGLGFAMEKCHPFMEQMLLKYNELSFELEKDNFKTKTVVDYTTDELVKCGLLRSNEIQQIEGITIYPREFFCPYNVITSRMEINPQTRTIHHYLGSWVEPSVWWKLKEFIRSLFPTSLLMYYSKCKRMLYSKTED